jgi:hypothetical protein
MAYTRVAVTKSGRGAEGLSRLPRERCGAEVGSGEASLGDRARVPFGDALSVFEGLCVFWNVNGLAPLLPPLFSPCAASAAARVSPVWVFAERHYTCRRGSDGVNIRGGWPNHDE